MWGVDRKHSPIKQLGACSVSTHCEILLETLPVLQEGFKRIGTQGVFCQHC